MGESGMIRFLMSCFRRGDSRPRVPAAPRSPMGEPAPRMQMIDVEGMIRQASTRVSVDQLVRKGKKFINLLSREKIDELINRSVKTIVDKHRDIAAHRNAASAAQIEAESRAEFEELLRQYKMSADVASDVERSRKSLEGELEEIRFELDPEKPPAELRTEDPGAFEDFVRELDREVAQVFKIRKLILERSESPEAAAELKRVEAVLGTLLSKLVEVERRRFAASGGGVREIAMLQKRLEKLLAHIATMEAALKTLSSAKTFSNQQVQNVLRELGLATEDKNFEKKKEMLKVVFNATQGIRRKARELAARGITLEAPEEKAVFTDADASLSGVFSRSLV
jgi:hypothetical protein